MILDDGKVKKYHENSRENMGEYIIGMRKAFLSMIWNAEVWYEMQKRRMMNLTP